MASQYKRVVCLGASIVRGQMSASFFNLLRQRSNSEISDANVAAIIDHDVRRLQISMKHSIVMNR